jgi:rhodanese-related sulfurtransferase
LPYAGEVTPQEAWDMLVSLPDAVLVDVRTAPEWTFSGVPNLTSLGKDIIPLSWKIYPTYAPNEQFLAALKSEVAADAPVFFLCRTGGRSLDAAVAATQAGYAYAFNVTDGFDGPHDAAQRRGMVAGWKAAGLPWMQG